MIYNFITILTLSKGMDSIPEVIDWMNNIAHFILCNKTTTARKITDLMLNQVLVLHGVA